VKQFILIIVQGNCSVYNRLNIESAFVAKFQVSIVVLSVWQM